MHCCNAFLENLFRLVRDFFFKKRYVFTFKGNDQEQFTRGNTERFIARVSQIFDL